MPTTTDNLDTSYPVVSSLPQPAPTLMANTHYDGCWASSGTLEIVVEVDLIAANPIKYRDPTGLYKLEIRYNDIGSVAGARYYHSYVVVTDCDGKKYYYRGGPSKGGPSGGEVGKITVGLTGGAFGNVGRGGASDSNSMNSTSPGSGPGGDDGKDTGPWGYIETFYGLYLSGTIDWKVGPVPSLVIRDDGTKWDHGKDAIDFLNEVEKRHIPYNPVGANSNSVAAELVEKLGYPRPTPPVWAPGWAEPLLTPPFPESPLQPGIPFMM